MLKTCLISLFTLYSIVAYCQQQVMVADTSDINSITRRTLEIEEIEVKARLRNVNLLSGSTGINVNISEIKLLPNIIGDADPFKALQYMGGVSQAGEGNSGLYVRGGNNDQNLILLNGSVIQNPTHVLGMFSVFNPDIVERMRFIKSGIPAEYGGRLSSVVDIGTVNNSVDRFNLSGSVGLISSRLAIQTPLSDNFSVYGAFRGSYINSLVLPLLNKLGIDSALTSNRFSFFDANAGVILRLNNTARISAHFYYGEDNIAINEVKKYQFLDNAVNWNNLSGNLQLTYSATDFFNMTHSLSYSEFRIGTSMSWSNSPVNFNSGYKSIAYKADFFSIIEQHQLKYGTELNWHASKPHFVQADSLLPLTLNDEHNNMNSSTLSLYFRDEWTSNRFQLNLGIRANLYTHWGPYTDYMTDTRQEYGATEIIKNYFNIEPRIFGRVKIDNSSVVKLSASRHVQYINQLPVITIGIPVDIQLPAGLHVKPQHSWHYSGGYFKNYKNNDYETSAELYYRTLNNQLEVNSGLIETFSNNMLEKSIVEGKGWTYGLEMKLKKNNGRLSGWVAYNLAWSYRQFDAINQGLPFLARNDRRHDLSLVGIIKINHKWNLTALMVYASGNRLNLPLSWFIIDDQVVLEYGKHNSFEMPPFHRLDLSATYKFENTGKLRSELNFSIYNVYNRANPFQVFYSTRNYSMEKNYDFNIGMTYLLPIIPTVSWTFHL
jgi:hypothetical protein